MNLLAIALFVVPLPNGATSTAHERAFEPPRFEQVALADTPKSIWRTDEAGGATHLQSTLTCSALLGGFQRSQLLPFDNFGFDVGCNYDNPNTGRITIYLTRRTSLALKDDFATAQAALKANMTDAELIPGDTPMPGSALPFTGALYKRADGSRTGVWVADVAGWTLKFRATYQADKEKDVLDTMTKLVDGTQTTAGAHLGACAKAPAVARPGTAITDSNKIGSLALIGGILDATVEEKLKPGETIAEQWCAEESAGDREVPLLFWRNIANSGNAGAMDRISLMTMGEPQILVSSANPTAALILDETENKNDGPIVHQLTEKRGDIMWIFGFYNGRPSAVTLTPLAKDVVLGKKGPLSGYNSKTKSIIISSDALSPRS